MNDLPVSSNTIITYRKCNDKSNFKKVYDRQTRQLSYDSPDYMIESSDTDNDQNFRIQIESIRSNDSINSTTDLLSLNDNANYVKKFIKDREKIYRNKKKVQSEPLECCICMCPLLSNISNVCKRHKFHDYCIDMWLKHQYKKFKKRSCPVCRQTLKKRKKRKLTKNRPIDDLYIVPNPEVQYISSGISNRSTTCPCIII
jgi:hypothetical protein